MLIISQSETTGQLETDWILNLPPSNVLLLVYSKLIYILLHSLYQSSRQTSFNLKSDSPNYGVHEASVAWLDYDWHIELYISFRYNIQELVGNGVLASI